MIHITEQLRREEELARINLQLERMATTDSLTGLSNRRVFESQAVIEFSRANRNQRPLSVLVLDIDNFKLRNDTYGDAASDAALKMLGRVLKTLRATGRYCCAPWRRGVWISSA